MRHSQASFQCKKKQRRNLTSAHTRGLVPATSPCNKSRGQVSSCELAIFASKSSRRDQLWSLRLVPRIQISLHFWDKSLRLGPRNASCELFVFVRVHSSGDQLQGLVAGTSPLVCAVPGVRDETFFDKISAEMAQFLSGVFFHYRGSSKVETIYNSRKRYNFMFHQFGFVS